MKWKWKSIASKYSLFTVCLVLTQSLLVLGMLIAGGIIKQARETVYQSFESTVTLRASSLKDQIDNRWTNIDPYVQELSRKLPADWDGNEEKAYLTDVADTLISMLRVSGTTGTFVILHETGEAKSHAGLYIRDYDPETNSTDNSDLYQVLGPADISRKYQIPLDSVWHYGLSQEGGSQDFYRMPISAAGQSLDYRALGYWSEPFSITPGDVPVITYTVPLFDQGGEVRGVVGVEVSEEYIKKLLPANELATQDSPGYMIAVYPEGENYLIPLIRKGEYQKRLFGNVDRLEVKGEDGKYSICQVENANSRGEIYACIKSLDLYNAKNMPYDSGNWVVVGLMKGDTLFSFPYTILRIFLFALLVSLVLGAIAAGIISRRITKPITKLAEKVRNFDFTRKIKLERTGLEELDLLSQAVEISNQNLLDSTLKMSHIMDLVGIPIGAFEYSPEGGEVQVTKQIFGLLNLPEEDGNRLYVDNETFWARLDEVRKNPEPEERDVYRDGETERWIRISMSQHQGNSLGIIEDVTADMTEKRRIQYERDHDSLTRIYNREAFRKCAEEKLRQQKEIGTAAMVMMDLDGLKKVNDRLGHEYGDLYIKETAVCMMKIPKEHTVVGRRSGDEFFMLLYGYENREALHEQIKSFFDTLDRHPIVLPDGEQLPIRISAGVAWVEEEAYTFGELVGRADAAMYMAKNSGRGKVVEYGGG